MNKLKTYEAIFEEGENTGVYAVSLVENPAMEGLFIALSKYEVQLKEVDKEQRILMGLVLEPNKPIYRNQNGEEFNIVFNEATIKNLSYSFFKNKYHQNSTIEHDSKQKIEGVTFVESWIVEDPKNDKSNALGFSYPKGSWMATMKVDSDDVWNNYVKTGKVQGFSIDAMLSLKEVNLKSIINMSVEAEKSILEMLKDLPNQIKLAFSPEKTIQLGSLMSEDEAVKFEFEGEMLTVGAEVWVTAEDGTRVPVPVGEYPLESNLIMMVTEEGKVGELVEKPSMEEPEAEPAQMAEPQAEKSMISEQDAKDIVNGIKSILVKYAEQKQEIETLKGQLTELSNQPASKPIKAQVTMSEPKTAKERIFSKINQLK